nr:hypothetical protein 24 [Spirochaetaceae bacterium]
MRVSGFLMLLLFGLLVAGTVVADGLEPSNGIDFPAITETKTIIEEEVVAGQRGETLAAFAVEPKPSVDPITAITMVAGTAEYESPTVAGGIPVLPGGLTGIP